MSRNQTRILGFNGTYFKPVSVDNDGIMKINNTTDKTITGTDQSLPVDTQIPQVLIYGYHEGHGQGQNSTTDLHPLAVDQHGNLKTSGGGIDVNTLLYQRSQGNCYVFAPSVSGNMPTSGLFEIYFLNDNTTKNVYVYYASMILGPKFDQVNIEAKLSSGDITNPSIQTGGSPTNLNPGSINTSNVKTYVYGTLTNEKRITHTIRVNDKMMEDFKDDMIMIPPGTGLKYQITFANGFDPAQNEKIYFNFKFLELEGDFPII